MTSMLNSVLHSPICKVFFAGFESNTLALQRAGWQLSIEHMQHMDSFRLAMKYEPARLFAVTHAVTFHVMELMRNPYAAAEHLIFNVACIGNGLRFQIIPNMGPMAFTPFDATPAFTQTEVHSIEDLIPFRPVNPDAPEIVIAPSSVPELMDMILKLQDPKQKEIREKARKEAWRRGEAGNQHSEGYSPAADIKAQIIAMPRCA